MFIRHRDPTRRSRAGAIPVQHAPSRSALHCFWNYCIMGDCIAVGQDQCSIRSLVITTQPNEEVDDDCRSAKYCVQQNGIEIESNPSPSAIPLFASVPEWLLQIL